MRESMENTSPIKKCFIDIETTGLDPEKHGVFQVAGIIEVPGHEQTFTFTMKPFKDDLVNKETLAFHKMTIEILKEFEEPMKIYGVLVNIFSTYVNKYNKRKYGHGYKHREKHRRCFFKTSVFFKSVSKRIVLLPIFYP